MIQNTDVVSFSSFCMIDLYSKVIRELENNAEITTSISVLKKFMQSLMDNQDPFAKIENLASISSASEITILLFDHFEKINDFESHELIQLNSTIAADLKELLALMSDDDSFINELKEFLGYHEEDTAIESDLRAEKSDSLQGIDNSFIKEIQEVEDSDLDHLRQAKKLVKKETTESIISKIERKDSIEKIDFFSAIIMILKNKLNSDEFSLVYQIWAEKDNWEKFLNEILPSEINNIIHLLQTVIKNSARDLADQLNLMRQNINSLDPDFLNEFKQSNYSLYLYLNDEKEKIKTEEIKTILPKSKTLESPKIDPIVKEKLKSYFKNEINEFVNEITNSFDRIYENEIISDEAKKIFKILESIKDLCMIHGYESLELMSREMASLFKEIIEENLVFTTDSKKHFQAISESIIPLIESLNLNDEKKLLSEIFETINHFNQSLAIIEITEEKLITLQDPNLRDSIIQIIQRKIQRAEIDTKKLQALLSDYLILDDTMRIRFLKQILAKSNSYLEAHQRDISMLLLHSSHQEDFDILLEDDKPLDDKKGQKVTEFVKSGENFTTTQIFNFEEVRERFSIYESILKNKIKRLIYLFEEDDLEKIIMFSSVIEIEARWLAYEQIADLFNYFTLNIDEYFQTNNKEHLINELNKLNSSASTYNFNLDHFNRPTEKEEEQQQIEEQDKWISSVAEIIEHGDDDIDLDASDLDLQSDFGAIDKDIREVFIDEASSYISEIKEQLALLCDHPDDYDAISLAERASHTLKGASKMLSIKSIGDIAAKLEKFFEQASIHKHPVHEDRLSDIEKLITIIENILSGKRIEDMDIPKPSVAKADNYLISDDKEMLEVFQEESHESIENIENFIKSVQHNPGDFKSIRKIESEALSLKSAAKMLGLKRIGMMAELIEGTAETLIREQIPANKIISQTLKEAIDYIKELRLGNHVEQDDMDELHENIRAHIHQPLDSGAEGDSFAPEDEIEEIDEFFSIFIDEAESLISEFRENVQDLEASQLEPSILDYCENKIYTIKNSASALNIDSVTKFCIYYLNKHPNFNVGQLKITAEGLIDFINFLKLKHTENPTILLHTMEQIEELSEKNLKKAPENKISSNDGSVENLVTQSNDLLNQRENLNDELLNIQKILQDFHNNYDQNMDKVNRPVVFKNVDDILQSVNYLSTHLKQLDQQIDSNFNVLNQVIKRAYKESDEDTLRLNVQSFQILKNSYAINEELISKIFDISIDDIFYRDDKAHVFIDDKEYELIYCDQLLNQPIGFDQLKKLSCIMPVKSDKLYIFVAHQFKRLVDHEFLALNVDDGGNIQGTGILKGNKTVFLLSDMFLYEKFGIHKGEKFQKESNPAQILKISKKTISNRKAKALIVDDSQSIRKFMSDIFKNLGYESVLAIDGTDALNKLKKDSFDVILTDIEMPNMNGFELIKTVRENELYAEIPIIVLTGRAGEMNKDKAIEIGANSYILKPFKESELRQKLDDFIDVV